MKAIILPASSIGAIIKSSLRHTVFSFIFTENKSCQSPCYSVFCGYEMNLFIYWWLNMKHTYINIHLYTHIRIHIHKNTCINIYMCPLGYNHNGFVATHALGHMMYGYTLLVPMNQCGNVQPYIMCTCVLVYMMYVPLLYMSIYISGDMYYIYIIVDMYIIYTYIYYILDKYIWLR